MKTQASIYFESDRYEENSTVIMGPFMKDYFFNEFPDHLRQPALAVIPEDGAPSCSGHCAPSARSGLDCSLLRA
jgi:hypothetical protein